MRTLTLVLPWSTYPALQSRCTASRFSQRHPAGAGGREQEGDRAGGKSVTMSALGVQFYVGLRELIVRTGGTRRGTMGRLSPLSVPAPQARTFVTASLALIDSSIAAGAPPQDVDPTHWQDKSKAALGEAISKTFNTYFMRALFLAVPVRSAGDINACVLANIPAPQVTLGEGKNDESALGKHGFSEILEWLCSNGLPRVAALWHDNDRSWGQLTKLRELLAAACLMDIERKLQRINKFREFRASHVLASSTGGRGGGENQHSTAGAGRGRGGRGRGGSVVGVQNEPMTPATVPRGMVAGAYD